MVMVDVSMSRQIGQVSSDWRDLGDTAISVVSVIASCGVLVQRVQFWDQDHQSQDLFTKSNSNPEAHLCNS